MSIGLRILFRLSTVVLVFAWMRQNLIVATLGGAGAVTALYLHWLETKIAVEEEEPEAEVVNHDLQPADFSHLERKGE